jgi:hypothetical protein
LVNRLVTGVKPSPENPHLLLDFLILNTQDSVLMHGTFANSPKKNKIATRFLTGTVFHMEIQARCPTSGNFLLAEATAFCAFRPRTLGPGSYPPPSPDSATYLEQAGDLELK